MNTSTYSAENTTISKQSSHYYPGLDTLRAIAILLVIVGHWLPYDHIANSFMPNGPLGVVLFFVLSGYLITGILLGEREKMRTGKKSFSVILKEFYIKRSLRIFPIYYLTLALLIFLQIPEVKTHIGWHLFYGTNILYYLVKSFTSDYVAAFWSLSVEEQFYLVWPFVILLSNKENTLKWLLASIVTGTCFRMLPQNLSEKPFSFLQFLTPACIDCFAIGGLIAYLQRYAPSYLFLARKAAFLCSAIGLVYILYLSHLFGTIDFIEVVFHRTLFSSFAALYIIFIITTNSEENLLAKWFQNSIFVFIGKISYSLYLWHMLIPPLENVESVGERFAIRLALLIAISSLSYFVLERPLLNLKKRFTA